jgi:hypothetical protein
MMPDSRAGYAVLAGWVIILGTFLMVAPDNWYGPTWWYFAQQGEMIIPAGGFGMGLCLLSLGVLQALTLWRRAYRTLSILLFLSGFVFWTSGLLLGAEGLVGHQGLMETPFMLFVGVHKFVMSVNLRSKTQHQELPK